MLDVAEAAGPGDRLHTLLLAMTGRVDDDAVNGTRELLGMAHLDTAAHFLTGCLLAGRITVSTAEQQQLRRVLTDLHIGAELADRLSVVDTREEVPHRFDAQAVEHERDVAATIAPVANRLVGLRGLWATWRTTPAGDSYGAVPRRVLLAEVGADGSLAAIGYQLLDALRHASVDCSVDVFASGAELPEYHREALSAARRVHLDAPSASPGREGVDHSAEQAVTTPSEPAAGTTRDAVGMARAASRESDTEGAPHRSSSVSAMEPVSVPEPTAAQPGAEPAVAESFPVEPEPADAEPGLTAEVDVSMDTGVADVAEPVMPEPIFPTATPNDEAVVRTAQEATSAARPAEPATPTNPATPQGTAERSAFDVAGDRDRPEQPDPGATLGTARAVESDTAEVTPSASAAEEAAHQDWSPSPADVAGTSATRAEQLAQHTASVAEDDAPERGTAADVGAAETDEDGSAGVPAAVDAKLTDRERNLLRKLHEELAQREQDRDEPDSGGQPVSTTGGQAVRAPEAWPQMTSGGAHGTGGFPPINPTGR